MPSMVFSTSLATDATRVWSHASSLMGVNEELWPLHMSGGDRLQLGPDTKTGQPLFRSVVSLHRVMPLDLHTFVLAEVWPGRGFRESSHSLLQRRWVHVRTIEAAGDGACVVRDSLEFAPRIFPRITSKVVRWVFQRRHAYLRRKFGAHSVSASRAADADRAAA